MSIEINRLNKKSRDISNKRISIIYKIISDEENDYMSLKSSYSLSVRLSHETSKYMNKVSTMDYFFKIDDIIFKVDSIKYDIDYLNNVKIDIIISCLSNDFNNYLALSYLSDINRKIFLEKIIKE